MEAAPGEAAEAAAPAPAEMTAAERRKAYQKEYHRKRRANDPEWADHVREHNRAYRFAHYHKNRPAILAARHEAAVERNGGVARRAGRPRLPPRCPPPAASDPTDPSASGGGVKESPE